MPIELAGLAALFFVAALIYSSVGFGGGSAYLALLSLSGIPLHTVAVLALVCNVIVVAGGSWHFVRAGHFSTGLTVPFLVASLPMAYLGGRYQLDADSLRIVMGLALMAAALALLQHRGREAEIARKIPGGSLWAAGALMGASIGGLSGLIGIGGGIFLAPVLHLLDWGTAKQIAATASIFILLNSLAGLAGKVTWIAEPAILTQYAILFVTVLAGGQMGSRLGAQRFPAVLVRRITAGVVFVAAVSLLIAG
jgi:uncharacterized protein